MMKNDSPSLYRNSIHARAYCTECKKDGRHGVPMWFKSLRYPDGTFFSHCHINLYECYHGHRIEVNDKGQDVRRDRPKIRFQEGPSYVFAPYIPIDALDK